jgi:hypothetical protein
MRAWPLGGASSKCRSITGPATVGLALSSLPILFRVLPSLARDAEKHERDPGFAITVAALLAYAAIVAFFLVLLDIE